MEGTWTKPMTFGLPVPFFQSTSPPLKHMPAHVPRSPSLVSLLHLPLAEYAIPFDPTRHCVMKNSGCIQSRLSWRTHLLSQFCPGVKCRFSSTSPRASKDRFHPLIPSTRTRMTRSIPIFADGAINLIRAEGLVYPQEGVNLPFFYPVMAEILSLVSIIPAQKLLVTLFPGRRKKAPISCGFLS